MIQTGTIKQGSNYPYQMCHYLFQQVDWFSLLARTIPLNSTKLRLGGIPQILATTDAAAIPADMIDILGLRDRPAFRVLIGNVKQYRLWLVSSAIPLCS